MRMKKRSGADGCLIWSCDMTEQDREERTGWMRSSLRRVAKFVSILDRCE